MRLPLLALTIALLPACAAGPPRNEDASRTARTDACVFQSSISGFKSLDDRHVVLYAFGNRDSYLAEVTLGCFGLQNQFELAAIDGDGNGQICGYGRDNIAYHELGRTESCRILSLEKATDERIAAILEKKAHKPRKVIIE